MRFYHTRVKVYDKLTGKSFLVGGIHTISEELVADWVLGGYLKPKNMLIPPKGELVEELKRLPAGGSYKKFYYCYIVVDDNGEENGKDNILSYKPEAKNSKIENKDDNLLLNKNIKSKIPERENIKTENFKRENLEVTYEPVQLSIFDIAKS